MKLWKIAAVGLASAVLAFALSGCQQESKEAPVPTGSMDVNDRQEASTDPFYVLIIGNDSREGTVSISDPYYADGAGRSDTMMLARIDPNNYQVTLVSIPRDTACSLDGSTVKINEAYHQDGAKGAIEQVEKLTGVSVKYYLDTDFVQFQNMVNEWGGLTVHVPMGFTLSDGVTGEDVVLEAGEQLLDGPSALALARMRKDYPSAHQEAMRQIQDRQLVERAIQQVAEDPARVASDVDTLLANTDTNWPTKDLVATINDFVEHSDSLSFYSGTGPYEGDIDDNAGGQWLVTRDEATWGEIMKVVDAGGDPTTVVPLPSL